MYNPKTHHRKSIRLKEFDYSNGGWYYVTICTNSKEHLFGTVVNNKVELNDYGKIVQEEWLKTKEIRKNIDLDDYVIMPNHFHGIIIIKYNENDLKNKLNNNVGATRWVAPNKAVYIDNPKDNEQENMVDQELIKEKETNQQLLQESGASQQIIQDYWANQELIKENRASHRIKEDNGASHRLAPTIQPNSLGSIIGQFKSVCTKRIKLMLNNPIKTIWQKNYYEHIIRNEEDLFRIRKYIEQNPVKWQLDEYY